MVISFLKKYFLIFLLFFSKNLLAQDVGSTNKNLCLSLSCSEFKSSDPENYFLEKNENLPKNRFLKVSKICSENIPDKEIIKCVLKTYQALDLNDVEPGEKDRILFLQDLQDDIERNLVSPLKGREKFDEFIEFVQRLENFGHESPKVITTIKDFWGKENPSCVMCNKDGRFPQTLQICSYDKQRNPIYCLR